MQPSEKRSLFTFEFWVKISMILVGIILIAVSFFVFNVLIPENLGGIWSSMDCHQKYSLINDMIWALTIGILITVAGISLILYTTIYTLKRFPPTKSAIQRTLGVKLWSLLQILIASLIIYYTLSWYRGVTIFGGPWGCSHSHHVPLYFPVAVLIVEIPAILLALFTYWRFHSQFFTGWIIIGTLRLLLGIIFFVIPWYYLIEPFTIINDLGFNILELTAGGLTLVGSILQCLTFSKIDSSE